ncbi:mucin-13 [Hemicordylus capensis]|uniref:mucin-13 n=1 Tax=Hemicordylus capensis TaxID=884348 RepID=UPI002303D725|nr:mucin-13 [Hemicordylus capensis]
MSGSSAERTASTTILSPLSSITTTPSSSPPASITTTPSSSPPAGITTTPSSSPPAGITTTSSSSPPAGITATPSSSPPAGITATPSSSPPAGITATPSSAPPAGITATPSSSPPAGNATTPSAPAGNATTPSSSPPAGNATTPSAPAGNATTPSSSPPAGNATTPSAPAGNATTPSSSPPAGNATTPSAPAGNATTPSSSPPAGNATTPSAPAGNATTPSSSPPAGNATTPSAPAGNATTPSPPVSNATAPSSTTLEPLQCHSQSCLYGATCIDLVHGHACQCLPYGFYYSTNGCQQGKVFPGQVKLNILYKVEMEIPGSADYKELYSNVTQFFNKTFENEESYRETRIISVKSTSTSTRLSKAEAKGNTEVTLMNMFDASTKLNSSFVEALIQKSSSPLIDSTSFQNVPQCSIYNCDGKTTTCNETGGGYFPSCDCIKNLAKKNQEDKACLLCSASCSTDNGKYCVMSKNDVPECQCLSDYKEQDGTCKKCPFGYSGIDCKNNYMVILIGVAVACGVVIVALTGALIYKALRGKKEPMPERKGLLSNVYEDLEISSQHNYATNGKIFPRIQTKKPTMDNQGGLTRNNHEAGTSNGAYIPDRDYDDNDGVDKFQLPLKSLKPSFNGLNYNQEADSESSRF